MLADFRQWFYPKEFRIYGIKGIQSDFCLEEIIREIENIVSKQSPPSEVDQFVREIGGVIWRWGNRMKALTNEITDNKLIERVERVLDNAMDVLKNNEIEIRDHKGRQYSHGSHWKIVGRHLVEGIKERIIFDTISPAILYRGALIQDGEIIVGEPDKEGRNEINH
mgnify:CR=1 FL=1